VTPPLSKFGVRNKKTPPEVALRQGRHSQCQDARRERLDILTSILNFSHQEVKGFGTHSQLVMIVGPRGGTHLPARFAAASNKKTRNRGEPSRQDGFIHALMMESRFEIRMQAATAFRLVARSFCAVRLILTERECRLRRLCILRNCVPCWTVVSVGHDVPFLGLPTDIGRWNSSGRGRSAASALESTQSWWIDKSG
jgi:hypothetical protein